MILLSIEKNILRFLEKTKTNEFYKEFAKLYSQFTHLLHNEPGLRNWDKKKTNDTLDYALNIMIAALKLKEINSQSEWKDYLKKAAEILELLILPKLNKQESPNDLISAAIYQIAGYPACSLGVLKRLAPNLIYSDILVNFLQNKFSKMLGFFPNIWTHIEKIPDGSEEKLILTSYVIAFQKFYALTRWNDNHNFNKLKEEFQFLHQNFMLYSDENSYLLSKLNNILIEIFWEKSFRNIFSKYSEDFSKIGKEVIEKYIRLNFTIDKNALWESQIESIEKIFNNESFLVCTPTGSGKTTIAEIAIIHSLFSTKLNQVDEFKRIVLYIVPSRALASEIESKFSKIFSQLTPKAIKITHLYGGTDWGVTDTIISSDEPTVLICTWEKSEALMRTIGVLLLKRLSCVIIDEVHNIQFSDPSMKQLIENKSRSLKLEFFLARLFGLIDFNFCRIIALSAVAKDIEKEIKNWITSNPNGLISNNYRSTRQLIGKLEYNSKNQYNLTYDIGNGKDLTFIDSGIKRKPYIKNLIPAPKLPSKWNNKINQLKERKQGQETISRPYCLWAAIKLAEKDIIGKNCTILISITQNIEAYIKEFPIFLEFWKNDIKFFQRPMNGENKILYDRCLKIYEDFFSNNSIEYLLLKKGIVIYQSNTPSSIFKYIIKLIENHVINIVIATSSLSEGVNLPFEIIIFPSLFRSGDPINIQEFQNLAGRVGRPGVSSEGKMLVFLHYYNKRLIKSYEIFIKDISKMIERKNSPRSAFLELLHLIYSQWSNISGSTDENLFFNWLESVDPLLKSDRDIELKKAVDNLDYFIISAIVEMEEIKNIDPMDLENKLKIIWSKTYAYHIIQNESFWEKVYLKRAKSIYLKIYPDKKVRKNIYKSTTNPKSAFEVINISQDIENLLVSTEKYSIWSNSERYTFFEKLFTYIGSIDKFRFGQSKLDWKIYLKWWFRIIPHSHPSIKSISKSKLYEYVRNNFLHLFNWGYSCVLSYLTYKNSNDEIFQPDLTNWEKLKIPWIALWIKDMVNEGTMEPIAVLLLSGRICTTRAEAEQEAKQYYIKYNKLSTSELYKISRIKNWVETLKITNSIQDINFEFKIKTLIINENLTKKFIYIFPVLNENITWYSFDGDKIVITEKPESFNYSYIENYDFTWDGKAISYEKYI